MKLAWALLLLAACKEREAPSNRAPIRPPVQELDRLPAEQPEPPQRPAAAPRQPTSLDQVLECFSDPISVPVPQSISSVTTGDFDRDGRTDVTVTYETLQDQVFTGHVVVYRNTGDGRLQEHSSITAGDMVYAVSSGDIDGDGNLDLAVGDPRGGKTRLYAGIGDGTFVEKPGVASGRKPYGATLVDLDGDTKLDLITELFSAVAIYKGDGKFGFKRRTVLDTGQAPDGPVVADLDGDKVLDLGYAANDEGYFFTLKGPGYRQHVKDQSCGEPAYVSGGDFDDDGDTDIGYVCSERIELRLNDGKGNFKLVSYPYGPAEEPIVAADLTRDGKTDLLVAYRNRSADPFDISATLVLLEGLGNGEWRERATGRLPIISGMKVADMDGDQKLDIVLATWTGNQAAIVVLLGQDC